MKREIKYRAWDKEEKQMGNVLGFYFGEHGWVDIEMLEERDDSDMKDKEYDDVEWRARMKDVELMQFIGLLDKNDKEICSGDIVNLKWEDCKLSVGGIMFTYVVTQDKAWFGLQGFDGGDIKPMYELKDKPCEVHGKEEMLEHSYEIIGNIYQDKSLLK